LKRAGLATVAEKPPLVQGWQSLIKEAMQIPKDAWYALNTERSFQQMINYIELKVTAIKPTLIRHQKDVPPTKLA